MYPKPFPQAGSGDVQVFNQPSTSTDQWHTWHKPKGCTLVYILCIGGGGGGGGGMLHNSGSNHSGGGGGAGSSNGRLLVPACFLPDVLYVQVGIGGAGGAPGTTGNNGTAGGSGSASFVSIDKTGTASDQNVIIYSGDGATPGGAGGTTTSAGGGAAPYVGSLGNMPKAGLGYFQQIAGQAGTSSNFAAAGSTVSIPNTSGICMGGTGGGSYSGGGDTAGGGIVAVTNSLLSQMRASNPIAGANDGSAGFNVPSAFLSFPGLGGGCATGAGGNGGNGGNGYYGSGGGGGGAVTDGTPAGTGGNGGRGGDGVVIIISA